MRHGTRTVTAFFVAAMYSLTIGAAQPPAGTLVAAIQTASGNYLTAVNGGGLGGQVAGPAAVALRTDATAVGPWEIFTVVWLNSTCTQFALQTSGGNYVTAVNGGGIGGPNDSSSPVHTDTMGIAEWERLTLNFLPNNQLTIKLPNGRFLTAINGGGIRGPDSAAIRTDAVRHAMWETFTLVKPSTVSNDEVAPAPVPGPAPASNADVKLTRAERAVINKHFGKHLPYHVGVSRSTGFPEVLRVTQYIDDAGEMTLAVIVEGVWVDSGEHAWAGQPSVWIPDEVTHHVLQAGGWPTLDEPGRKSLALRWILDALPPGFSSQTTADGGHTPEVSIDDGDVIVRVWLIRRRTSIAGPRVTRDNFATVFRLKPEGSMTESEDQGAAAGALGHPR